MPNNKNWVGNENSIYTTLGASDHSEKERVKDDYYATDPTAIDDLLGVEDFSDKIWEPACGEGHLSKRMKKYDKNVYSTDLVDRGFGDEFLDFLKTNKRWQGDIITNPPYRYAKEFVEKALEVVEEGSKVAFFMKLTFLESKERESLFKTDPPKKVWVYSYRKGVARNGDPQMFSESSAVCYAWFVWEKGYRGNPEVDWITKNGKLKISDSKQTRLRDKLRGSKDVSLKDLYLKFIHHIKTERVDGEVTHFYKGKYSLDGNKWKEATLIFDSDFNSWQFYHQNKEEVEEVMPDGY